MKENHEEYRANEPSFLKNKSIYVILGLCVIASGVFAWMGVNNQLSEVEQQNKNATQQIEKPVEQKKEDVPKPPTSSGSEQSAQQQAQSSTMDANSSKQKEASKPSAASQAQSYIMPIEGEIIHPFSNGELVKSNTLNDWRTHNGVDIKANLNDAVKAVGTGVIKDIYENPLWGTVIELQLEDGVVCVYSNLNAAPNVKKGQKVTLGETLGTVGNTASVEISEPSHLHFEVLKESAYLDPVAYLKQKK